MVTRSAPTGAGLQWHTVRGQQFRIHVRPGRADRGGPDRPPLLLANGIGAPLEALDPFVEALDPALEVVRFDAPGVGGSPTPKLPHPFPLLAGLLGEVLTRLGHDRVDVLGFSWGGALAQQFAFQNPRRCRRLVLVATGTGSTTVPGRPAAVARLLFPRALSDPAQAGPLYGGRLRAGPVPRRAVGVVPADSRGYLYQLLSASAWSSLPFLPLLRQRTLVLAGNDDPLVPLVNARLLARLIPRARLEVYPDGHLGLLTRAGELAALVGAFLGEP